MMIAIKIAINHFFKFVTFKYFVFQSARRLNDEVGTLLPTSAGKNINI